MVADFEKMLELAFEFHGHRCPAMPLGLKSGLKAMEVLGVDRAKDKELYLIAETGKAHAAGCFLDGLQVATGCTYGKSNAEKKYWNKPAFTLIDTKKEKAVRVRIKPEAFQKMLNSPFVQERKKGIPPQDVDPAIANPLIENVIKTPIENFIDIGPVEKYDWKTSGGDFNAVTCDKCGEAVFIGKTVEKNGKRFCIPCAEKG